MSTHQRHQHHGALRGTLAAVVVGVVSSQAADPSNDQQYWLELVNRMRMNPSAELDLLVNLTSPGTWDSPKSDDPSVAAALDFYGTDAATLSSQWSTLVSAPPVAWNGSLAQSAGTYSDIMVTQDRQDHNLDGQTLSQRILAGGYSSQWLEFGENLFATTQSATHGHGGFVLDWGDGNGATTGFGSGIQDPPLHRIATMDDAYKEIGIGYQNGAIPGTNVEATGPLVVTQHFGSSYRIDGTTYISDAILTGVIFADNLLADAFYTPGEGWAGIVIQVFDDVTNTLLASGTSNAAGGFNIPLTGLVSGVTYRAEAQGTGTTAQSFTLTERTENYGVDVTIFDNAYASFMAVPEPSSAVLSVSALIWLARRNRRTS
jgi:hypothetical protein